ncbi:hypothetical protein SESBI_00800 [Sesbania bispinosa]|nr:hypothetical protein SESBI_00800 [Sesbania bispinosa]
MADANLPVGLRIRKKETRSLAQNGGVVGDKNVVVASRFVALADYSVPRNEESSSVQHPMAAPVDQHVHTKIGGSPKVTKGQTHMEKETQVPPRPTQGNKYEVSKGPRTISDIKKAARNQVSNGPENLEVVVNPEKKLVE